MTGLRDGAGRQSIRRLDRYSFDVTQILSFDVTQILRPSNRALVARERLAADEIHIDVAEWASENPVANRTP